MWNGRLSINIGLVIAVRLWSCHCRFIPKWFVTRSSTFIDDACDFAGVIALDFTDGLVLLLAFMRLFFAVFLAKISCVRNSDIKSSAAKPSPGMGVLCARFIGLVDRIRAAHGGATDLAKLFGISDFVIGLTVVAIGTSCLSWQQLVAAKRGQYDIAVGNDWTKSF